MASSVTAADATDEARAWWLRFNNGVAVDEDDEEEVSEEEGHGARDAKAELVAGGRKAGAEAAGAYAGDGTERRSSPRLADDANGEEVSGGSNGQLLQGGMPPRKRKVITKRTKLQVDGAEEQNDRARSECQSAVLNGAKRFHLENENLKLQLALKTKELELEENRRLKLELILKTKENESLLKQNEELKAENERLKRTAKPPRTRRLCRSCQSFEFHDSRNCPEKQQAARSSEEEDYE
ncbi:hypothetical protein EJB05_31594, partial [Eragrostis curvula]